MKNKLTRLLHLTTRKKIVKLVSKKTPTNQGHFDEFAKFSDSLVLGKQVETFFRQLTSQTTPHNLKHLKHLAVAKCLKHTSSSKNKHTSSETHDDDDGATRCCHLSLATTTTVAKRREQLRP